MLKQLRLNIDMNLAKTRLSALVAQKNGFETRKTELERRFAEVAEGTPEETIRAIETDIDALELEVRTAGLEAKIKAEEDAIVRMQTELEAIGKDGQPPAADPNQENERGAHMGNMNLRERIRPYIEREDVKKFAESLRAVIGEGNIRAVTNAGINIPIVILEPLRENVEKYSKLLKYINLKRIKGQARQPIVGTVPEAIWSEMDGVSNEVAFAFNMLELDGYMLDAFIPILNYYAQDSDINLVTEVMDMLAKSMARSIDKAIVYGKGVKMPLGIVTRLANATAVRNMGTNAPAWTDLTTTNIKKLSSASLTPTEIFAELVLGLGKARSAYAAGGKFWAMSETTWNLLQSKMISINAAGAFVTGASLTMPVIGGDIVLLDFMPANVIAGGYGSLYPLAEREGATISKSEHVRFLQSQTIFKGQCRYDGAPIVGEGFAMFTLSTTDGATTLDFAEDKANPEDAYLTALSGTDLTLSPTFDKDTLAYTASVANAVETTTITATARTYGKVKSIKVGTTAATAGACALAVGANTITVVTEYGTSVRTYTVVVTRAAT